MSEWYVRDAIPEDEDMLVSLWLMSYCATREGWSEGASAPLDDRGEPTLDRAKRSAFWDLHRPVVMELLRTSTVRVVCDVADPFVAYAWACFDEARNVVHHAVVKRAVTKALGVHASQAMVRALLGDMLERSCGYTYFARDLLALDLLPRGGKAQWYPHVGALVSASWKAKGVAA